MSGSATRALASSTRRFMPEESVLEPGVGVEAHPGDDRVDPVIGVGRRMALVGQSLGHLVGDRAAAALGHLLGQPGDPQALLADHLALVGLELALGSAGAACSCPRRCGPAGRPARPARSASRPDPAAAVRRRPG